MPQGQFVRTRLLPFVLPSPAPVRHAEYSMLYSADDETSQPSPFLMTIAIKATESARKVSMKEISARMKAPPYFPDVWPGEHYKLLAGLVQVLKPKVVVEIGTHTGLSALAMKQHLPRRSTLHTFDVIPWTSFSETCLREADFADRTLVQHTDDLSLPAMVHKHERILSSAELLFIDAAKDGSMEEQFIENFKAIPFRKKPLMVFDDIRLWNMLKVWRSVSYPKLDMTSFGHWSGTGLVEWDKGPKR